MKKLVPVAMLAIALLVAACATPTVEPTKAPAPTSAPAAEPTKAPVATVAPTAAPKPTEAPKPTVAPTTAAVTPKSGGVLKIIVPAIGTWGNVKQASYNPTYVPYLFPVVETLVGLTKDGPAPTKLATSWDVAPDGKSITFKLRQGVKFHDGTDFNAEAVKWNLDQIIKDRAELKVITSVSVVDPYTVRLNLSEFSTTLLYNLCSYGGLMLSPASIQGRDAQYVATRVVGTGPFELVSAQQGANAVFKKFANYWDKGKPYLDGMEFVVVGDANTARSALLSGQVQVWDYVTPKNIADLRTQGYSINTVPGVIRVAHPDSANADSPFAKKEVRQALEYAVDKKALADALGAGTWEVPVGPCSKFQIGCSAITQGRDYDPAKAKQLLAQAGYPNGFKTSIYAPTSVDQEVLTALQGYFKAVGIDADIQVQESAKLTTTRTKGWQNGMIVQGIGVSTASYVQALQVDGPGPTKSFSTLVTPAYSDLLKKADAATDPATQKALSEQLAKLVQDEAVVVAFAVESRNAAYAKKINIDLDTISLWFWNPGDSWISQ